MDKLQIVLAILGIIYLALQIVDKVLEIRKKL
ncbi:hypothetical protein AN619_02850 [Thermotalea metallivorans]|uniref:Uncharacterized protein n=1 Tax=Thermotalea metallivorans TaxID=520762 RepID=A0A140LCN5_9FIRM|nr:hypothetical protein AN619_02850 [Thermotalea metallivorans]